MNNLSPKYPPFIGHEELVPLETKILPYWKDFLANPEKDIKEFRRSLMEDKKIAQWAITERRK
ncbi:MAG: hypothetical protein HQM09_23635 [Candidatus Riflebacteria bacterium]|nr:hypothetical protein [Candidatus Riflebacteria bacterium]